MKSWIWTKGSKKITPKCPWNFGVTFTCSFAAFSIFPFYKIWCVNILQLLPSVWWSNMWLKRNMIPANTHTQPFALWWNASLNTALWIGRPRATSVPCHFYRHVPCSPKGHLCQCVSLFFLFCFFGVGDSTASLMRSPIMESSSGFSASRCTGFMSLLSFLFSHGKVEVQRFCSSFVLKW